MSHWALAPRPASSASHPVYEPLDSPLPARRALAPPALPDQTSATMSDQNSSPKTGTAKGEASSWPSVTIDFTRISYTVKDRRTGNSLEILKGITGKASGQRGGARRQAVGTSLCAAGLLLKHL